MASDVNRQWILRDRPKGQLAESGFELRRAPVPEPGPGEVLTRTLYISVDAANRAWMSPVRTYTEPAEPGRPMRAMTLGQVVRSNDPSLSAGDIVEGIGDGRLKIREDIVDGLEHAPRALIGLLKGDNTGKRMVRVASESA